MSANELTKKFRYQQRLIQIFWKQWRDEYLTSLREYHSTRKGIRHSQEIRVGDVVLIHDDTSRNQWRLGLIIELHRGNDDLIRAVTLRVSNGRKISRPIEKLYPLELHEKQESTNPTLHQEEHQICPDKQIRPKRAAAQVAAKRIKEQSV